MGRAVRSHKGAQKMAKYTVKTDDGKANKSFNTLKDAMDCIRGRFNGRVYGASWGFQHEERREGEWFAVMHLASKQGLLEQGIVEGTISKRAQD